MTNPDGTPAEPVRPGTRPAGGHSTDHNGVVRVHDWRPVDGVAPGSPEAAFPENLRRPAQDRGRATYYPLDWTAQIIDQRVQEALVNRFHTEQVPADALHWVEGATSRHLQPVGTGTAHHFVGEAGGVRIEGIALNGRIVLHSPTLDQPHAPHDGWAGEEHVVYVGDPHVPVDVDYGPPLTVRRVLFDSGQEGLEITAGFDLRHPGGLGHPDARAMTAHLQGLADAYVRDAALDSPDAPPVRILLEFDDTQPGRPRIDMREDVVTSFDELAPELAEAVEQSGLQGLLDELVDGMPPMDPGARRFAVAVSSPHDGDGAGPGDGWVHGQAEDVTASFAPGLAADAGRRLPEGWSAEQRRYAAHLVRTDNAGTPLAEALGWVGAPLVHRGSFGGLRINVRTENGLITDFWGEAHHRTVPATEDLGRPLTTVEPPQGAFLRGLEARDAQRFEVHRRELPGGDHESVLTVRLHLDTRGLELSDAGIRQALDQLKARMAEGVDRTYNLGQRLPNGDLLRVRADLVETPGPPAQTVVIAPGPGREHHLQWHLGTDATTLAHELGHHLGLPDEYTEARPGRGRRPGYQDGGLMGSLQTESDGRHAIGADQPAGVPLRRTTDAVLQPRNLRQLGAGIDRTLDGVTTGYTADGLPKRAKLDADVIRTALHGEDGPRGRGGHLLPPSAGGRERPRTVAGSLNRNGTFEVAGEAVERTVRTSALAGDIEVPRSAPTTRMMFPRHWTTEQAAYAAEQAHHAALRAGERPSDGAVPGDGNPLTARREQGYRRSRATAESSAPERGADATYHWLGEYGGVRIEGEVRGDRIVSFRPSAWQEGLDAAAHVPYRAAGRHTTVAERFQHYGDRRELTGVHHHRNPVAARFHGVRVDPHTRSETNENGTYRATVWYLRPGIHPDSVEARFPGNWERRQSGAEGHTFYPEQWTRNRIETAVEEAYQRRGRPLELLPDGSERWSGIGDGVRIEGITTQDGRHLVHRPATAQPHSRWSRDQMWRTEGLAVDLGSGRRLIAHHFVFAGGQTGVTIDVPVHVPVEVTPQERRQLQNQIHDHLTEPAGWPLARVRLVFVDDPAQARSTGANPMTVLHEAESRAQQAPEQIRGAIRSEGRRNALTALMPDVMDLTRTGRSLPDIVRDLAGPIPPTISRTTYEPPRTQPLRTPDPSRPAVRPEGSGLVDMAASAAGRVSDAAMPGLAAGAGRGMPEGWSQADRRSLAREVLEEFRQRRALEGGTLPRVGTVLQVFPTHRVLVSFEDGRITDFRAEPNPAAGNQPGPGGAVRPPLHSPSDPRDGRTPASEPRTGTDDPSAGSEEALPDHQMLLDADTAPESDPFEPVGPRVVVEGDGLCLLHAVAVSAPDLVTQWTARSADPIEGLRRHVEDHYRRLDAAAFPAEVVRAMRWEQLGNLSALRDHELLAHIPAEDRDAFAGMRRAELEPIVAQFITEAAPTSVLPHERETLLRAIRNWQDDWNSVAGEMLPPALAHALNLRLRVMNHDGVHNFDGYGPAGGRRVAVYYDVSGRHYDASEPIEPHVPTELPASIEPPVPAKRTSGGESSQQNADSSAARRLAEEREAARKHAEEQEAAARRLTEEEQFPPRIGAPLPVHGEDGLSLLESVASSAPETVRRILRHTPEQVLPERPAPLLREAVSQYVHTEYRELPREIMDLVDIEHWRELNPELRQVLVRNRLRAMVDDWVATANGPGAAVLPAVLAHALGVRLQVVRKSAGGVEPVAELGPRDGEVVFVYHRDGIRYDASTPVPREPRSTESEGPRREEPAQHESEGSESRDASDTSQGSKREASDGSQAHDSDGEWSQWDDSRSERSERSDRDEADSRQGGLSSENRPTDRNLDESAERRTPVPSEIVEELLPAPEPPRPLVPMGPAERGRIAGTDLLIGLTENEGEVRKQIIELIENTVGGDRTAARSFADAYFGPGTLRPLLTALSRGETWVAPFDGNGWSGSISLRGTVTESTYLRTQKIEFENGADRSVMTGTRGDVRWQYNIGLQSKHTSGTGELAELVGYFHDRGHGEVGLDSGGTVARSKTSEPARVYGAKIRLEIDYGNLRHEGALVHTKTGELAESVQVGATVAVPERPPTPEGEHRVPPRRLRDGRVGGQEIVLDLSPDGRPQGRRPMEVLLEPVEAAARAELRRHWPALRDKLLAEVDFGRLQRDLKSMTAGEPVTVEVTDRRGRVVASVEITARVEDLRQVGTTDETEFNIGTVVQQVRSSLKNRGHAGQFPVVPTFGPKLDGVLVGAGATGRLGREHVEVSGHSRVSQLTSKSKVPGVVYDGTVRFELAFHGSGVRREAAATVVPPGAESPVVRQEPESKVVRHEAGRAAVRLLVDRADTQSPAEAQGIAPVPPPGSGEDPRSLTHEVAGPPDTVWHTGDGPRGPRGLGESVVLRDLESTAELRTELESKGRELFKDGWDAIRAEVLCLFSQPMLASRLTAMTRGEPLESKLHGKDGIVVTAVARVETMTYRREDGKAELNPVNETGAFSAGRRLLARTTAAQGQLGGVAGRNLPGGDVLATAGGQQRDRFAWRDRGADRVYANGKYGAAQVVYGAELVVDVHLGKGRVRPDVSVSVRVEVGMDSRETVKVEVPRSTDGTALFSRPETDGDGSTDGSHVAEGSTGSSSRHADQLDTYTAPRRMTEQHELNASYVVHTLSDADQVRRTIEDAVRAKYGEPSDEVRQRIGETFDRVALKTQLSRLTRGGRITETVSGRLWSADITVTAKLGEATYRSMTGKYEFESGTQASNGQGYARDRLNRYNGGALGRFKSKFVDVTGGYSYRLDRSYGDATDTVGSVSNRGKHVEAAVFFDVAAEYDVNVTFRRLNVRDGSPFTDTVTATAQVAVPLRDADPASTPKVRKTEKQPVGFLDVRRLDSSAIVTDVFPVHRGGPAAEGNTGKTGGGGRRMLGESILDQVESKPWPRPDRTPVAKVRPDGHSSSGPDRPPGSDPLPARTPVRTGSNPFRSDWDGLRRKLVEELTPDRLQARLKAMTAGDEIVVRHGRTTVRVSAALREPMHHLGDSGITEFNAATQVQRTFASSDGVTNFGAGHGHNVSLAVAGTIPVAGAVPVTVGLAGNYGWGKDHQDLLSRNTAAGAATKAKVPGSAFSGEAELRFQITRRPLLGASVQMMRNADIGFETIVESGETRPVPEPVGTRDPRAVSEQVTVPVPPERVWTTGLRDTDVLRWLGDVGGVQDLVRLRGREYFGAGAWRRIGNAVENVTSHSHLSALFGTASQGMEIATASPGRWLLGEDRGVEIRVKVVELEHRVTDGAVELSPGNATSFASVLTELSAKQAGLQGQVGVKLSGDITNTPAVTGGAQRLWRDGGVLGDAGQVIVNGKFPTPMARYAGAATIEVTFFDGTRQSVTERGAVPFTVDIPLAETAGRDVPAEFVLAFTDRTRNGDLRVAGDARLVDDVHAFLERGRDDPRARDALTAAESEQLVDTVRWGRLAYDTAFTTRNDAGQAHVRATRQLVEWAAGASTDTATLVRELLGGPDGTALRADELRRVVDHIERQTARGEVLTLADLRAWAAIRRPAATPPPQFRSPLPVEPLPPVEPAEPAAPAPPTVLPRERDVAPDLPGLVGSSLADDIANALKG